MNLLYSLRRLAQGLRFLGNLDSAERQPLHDFLDLVPRASHQHVQPILLSPRVIVPPPNRAKNGFLADEEQVARQKNRQGRILLSLTLTPKSPLNSIPAKFSGSPYTNSPRYVDLASEQTLGTSYNPAIPSQIRIPHPKHLERTDIPSNSSYQEAMRV